MTELVIEADQRAKQYWRDLWRYRELFLFLAWRDLLVRYKQTVVGLMWSLIRPLITMGVLVFVFGKISKLSSGDIPYSLLVFAGVLPWQFFSTALSESANSLVSNSNLISKIYFPRLIIPASSVITCFVDFLVSGLFFVCLMAWHRFIPPWTVLCLPIFLLLAVATAFGVGLWVATLMVKYRDFRFIVPFIVQFGLYVSPVGFSSQAVPQQWRFVYSLNPIVGVIDGFRWSLLGDEHSLYWPGVVASISITALLLLAGISYFRRAERTFADVI